MKSFELACLRECGVVVLVARALGGQQATDHLGSGALNIALIQGPLCCLHSLLALCRAQQTDDILASHNSNLSVSACHAHSCGPVLPHDRSGLWGAGLGEELRAGRQGQERPLTFPDRQSTTTCVCATHGEAAGAVQHGVHDLPWCSCTWQATLRLAACGMWPWLGSQHDPYSAWYCHHVGLMQRWHRARSSVARGVSLHLLDTGSTAIRLWLAARGAGQASGGADE